MPVRVSAIVAAEQFASFDNGRPFQPDSIV
jgi:hypothetical protein